MEIYDIIMDKIDDELIQALLANFIPEYPVNGWPNFKGLFNPFYQALEYLCEFGAPNVLLCEVGKRVKNILKQLKRYLSKMGLITWSLGTFSISLSFGKKLEFVKSQKISGKHDKNQKKFNTPTKRKDKTEAFRDAPGMKPKLETQQPGSRPFKDCSPIDSKGTVRGKRRQGVVPNGSPMKSSPTQSIVCGLNPNGNFNEQKCTSDIIGIKLTIIKIEKQLKNKISIKFK